MRAKIREVGNGSRAMATLGLRRMKFLNPKLKIGHTKIEPGFGNGEEISEIWGRIGGNV